MDVGGPIRLITGTWRLSCLGQARLWGSIIFIALLHISERRFFAASPATNSILVLGYTYNFLLKNFFLIISPLQTFSNTNLFPPPIQNVRISNVTRWQHPTNSGQRSDTFQVLPRMVSSLLYPLNLLNWLWPLFCWSSNLLYPKEDRSSNTLVFACRTCHVDEPATSYCVFQNKLNSQVGETAGVTQDVGSDPTVGLPLCLLCGQEVYCDLCDRLATSLFAHDSNPAIYQDVGSDAEAHWNFRHFNLCFWLTMSGLQTASSLQQTLS